MAKLIKITRTGHGIGGYLWSIHIESSVGKLINATIHAVEEENIGSGSNIVWYIEKNKGGEIKLVYRRPWNSDTDIVEEIETI